MLYNTKQIRDFFSEKVGISDSQLLDLAQEIAVERVFKKNEEIITIGEIQSNLYFLVEGVVFGTLPSEEETQITFLEYVPGTPVSGFIGIQVNAPAITGLVAATKSVLLEIPYQAVVDYRAQFPEINELTMRYISRSMVQQQRVRRMYSMSAEEKTLWFQEQYPMVKNILQKKYIAQFLGLDACVYRRTVRNIERQMIGKMHFSPVI